DLAALFGARALRRDDRHGPGAERGDGRAEDRGSPSSSYSHDSMPFAVLTSARKRSHLEYIRVCQYKKPKSRLAGEDVERVAPMGREQRLGGLGVPGAERGGQFAVLAGQVREVAVVADADAGEQEEVDLGADGAPGLFEPEVRG